MEYCPICGGLAQVQGTRVMSRHPVTNTPQTVQRNMRCKDPLCHDPKGVPPSWRIGTEFIAWSPLIPHNPTKVILAVAEQGDLFGHSEAAQEKPPELKIIKPLRKVTL